MKLISMTKLGFDLRSYETLTIGEWTDLWEEYKAQYNFEQNQGRYRIFEKKISSLDEL